jgi:hypothetical protein
MYPPRELIYNSSTGKQRLYVLDFHGFEYFKKIINKKTMISSLIDIPKSIPVKTHSNPSQTTEPLSPPVTPPHSRPFAKQTPKKKSYPTSRKRTFDSMEHLIVKGSYHSVVPFTDSDAPVWFKSYLPVFNCRRFVGKYPTRTMNAEDATARLRNIQRNYHYACTFLNGDLKVLHSLFFTDVFFEGSKRPYMIVQPMVETNVKLSHQEEQTINTLIEKIYIGSLDLDLKMSNIGRRDQDLVLLDFLEEDQMTECDRKQLLVLWQGEQKQRNVPHVDGF